MSQQVKILVSYPANFDIFKMSTTVGVCVSRFRPPAENTYQTPGGELCHDFQPVGLLNVLGIDLGRWAELLNLECVRG